MVYYLWCWTRLLRVPWTPRRSNQSTLNEISPEYSWEGLMLMLQHSGHLRRRTDFSNKTLMLGKTEGRRKRGWQRWQMIRWHHRLDGHEFEQIPGDGDRQGILACCSPGGRKESDTTEQLNWHITTLAWIPIPSLPHPSTPSCLSLFLSILWFTKICIFIFSYKI